MDSNSIIAAVDIYDAVMLAVLVGATVFGAYKGMAWQVTSLASIVVSAVVAIRFSGSVAPYISDQAPWNRFIAMFILYLLTSFSIWILFRLVAGAINRVKLKEFDRQMGAMFGMAKGVLFCVVITFFAVTLSESFRQTVLASFSGRCIAILIKNATPVMPDEVTDVVGKYLDELDRRLDPSEPAEEGLIDRVKSQNPPSGIDSNLDELGQKANEKLDEAQQGLDKKAAELRKAIDDRLDGGGK